MRGRSILTSAMWYRNHKWWISGADCCWIYLGVRNRWAHPLCPWGCSHAWWLPVTCNLVILVPLPVDPLTGCLMAVLAAVCSGLLWHLNVCIDQFVYRPLRNAPPLSPLVSTIGVSFVLMNVGLIWIGRKLSFPEIFLSLCIRLVDFLLR